MRCHRCGTDLPNSALYCSECGIRQEEFAASSTSAVMTDHSEPAPKFDPIGAEGVAQFGQPTHAVVKSPIRTHDRRSAVPVQIVSEGAPSYSYSPSEQSHKAPVAAWLAFAGSLAVVMGSLGPWATITVIFGSVSIGGMKGDGQITIVLGILAAALLLFRAAGSAGVWTSVFAFILLNVTWIVGAYDWTNLQSVANPDEAPAAAFLQIGWGLIAVTFGGALGAISLLVHWGRHET